MKTAATPQAAQKAVLAAIVAGAIAASILGAHALQQAVIRARDLYQVDTAGSQMEGNLEFETQESRRAFLYALAVTDPNDQLPYVLEARAASQRVDQAVKQLRRLGVPEITARLADFQRCWNQYDVARDEIIMQILTGNSQEALRVESDRGRPSFSAALGRLHALKAVLEARARTDSSEVNATLRRSIGALIAFVGLDTDDSRVARQIEPGAIARARIPARHPRGFRPSARDCETARCSSRDGEHARSAGAYARKSSDAGEAEPRRRRRSGMDGDGA